MGYLISNVDRKAFAEDLLDIAKTHMRVNFATDDDYIALCIVRATDLVERHSGATIFAADVAWSPVVIGTRSVYPFPVQPVTVPVVCKTADGTDVSAEYSVTASSPTNPVFLVHTDGSPPPAGLAVEYTSGFAADDMPPQYLDPILRIAAHLYEHRESVDTTGFASIPQWANDLLMGNWIPRA